MHVAVIHHWQEVTPELTQALATALGITAFDARQRLVSNGPAVVSCLADPQLAQAVSVKLQKNGFNAFVVDVEAALSKRPVFSLRRFKFESDSIHIEEIDGRKSSIAYKDIKFILPAFLITKQTETNAVTEKKFSVGKTIMSGGIPMRKNVSSQEVTAHEEREKVLYLCGGNRARIIGAQSTLLYDGLGEKMQPSKDMNFNSLVAEMRQRCPNASYDDRLLRRAEQVKLLGPTLSPDSHIDLAVDILASIATEDSVKNV